jgi:peptidoglycan hydrolase CwlO-like protein
MITCCEIAITLALTNIISLAVFAGYTVKIRQSQVELQSNLLALQSKGNELEKKNGREQHQIDQLKAQVQKLEKQLHEMPPLPAKESSS